MSKKSSVVYQEIQETLGSCFWGISMSSLSILETRYHKEFERSLDYNSLSVNNMEELLNKMRNKGMVVFSEDPEHKTTNVMCANMVKIRQELLKHNVQQLLDDNGGSISLTSFLVSYKNQFKGKLDYLYFGLKDFDNLCSVLNLVVVEAACSGERVIKTAKINLRNMSTKSSEVYQQIREMLGSYMLGLPSASLDSFPSEYEHQFKRSLDYNSLGVTNIEELFYKMRDKGMVLFSEDPESKMTYWMCAGTVKRRQKDLKSRVHELLLDEEEGEILLRDFEKSYRSKFGGHLDYFYYGLKGFDSLCVILNLVVEAAPKGEVVKKAPKGEAVKKAPKICNSRKRKK